MKKIFCIIILLSFSRQVLGQTNLVPNSSFESYVNCPPSTLTVNNWFLCSGTADYYNSCVTTSTSLGVPANWLGYQSAYDGNAYMGLITYCKPCGPNREYIGVLLTQTLTIGTKYYVSAYISRSDSLDPSYKVCEVNKFGFKFTSAAYSYAVPAPTNNSSQVHSNTIIYDTLGWTKISGSFIADSSYKYCLIGNFYDNFNTDSSACLYTNSFAYYYVDKVCVSTDSMMCNVSTGIKNINATKKVSLYPNPTSGKLYIKLPDNWKIHRLTLYDKYGQVIFLKINLDNAEIDLASIPDGLYFIEIISNGKTYYDKIIVQN